MLDNWGNGGNDFTRTIPFHKLTAVMRRAEVEAAREAGLILGEQPIGFYLRPKPSQTEAITEPANPIQEEPKVAQPPAIPSGIESLSHQSILMDVRMALNRSSKKNLPPRGPDISTAKRQRSVKIT